MKNNETVLISFPMFEIAINIEKHRTDIPKQITPLQYYRVVPIE